MAMMICPRCFFKTHVTQSRITPNGVLRRRHCLNEKCKHAFTTQEIIVDLRIRNIRRFPRKLLAVEIPTDERKMG